MDIVCQIPMILVVQIMKFGPSVTRHMRFSSVTCSFGNRSDPILWSKCVLHMKRGCLRCVLSSLTFQPMHHAIPLKINTCSAPIFWLRLFWKQMHSLGKYIYQQIRSGKMLGLGSNVKAGNGLTCLSDFKPFLYFSERGALSVIFFDRVFGFEYWTPF